VLLYPKNWQQAGYFKLWLEGDVGLPQTVIEDLSSKPSVQREFLKIANIGLGELKTERDKLNYINFYANLMRASDANLVQVISTLRSTGLLDDTLIIRTADHGEMGLAHNGMRQKNFNAYEDDACADDLLESEVVPDPKDIRLADLARRLSAHAGEPVQRTAPGPRELAGSRRQQILNPRAPASQDYVVFTYDDFQSGQASGPYPQPPNHIVSLRERRWKLAKYYDVAGRARDQWEMYDLHTDPLETTNIAAPGHHRTLSQRAQLDRLKANLATVEQTRLQPL
jgi:arylsulfatase A-like enzyme